MVESTEECRYSYSTFTAGVERNSRTGEPTANDAGGRTSAGIPRFTLLAIRYQAAEQRTGR